MTSCNRQRELDRFALKLSQQVFAGEVEVIFVAQGSAQLRLPTLGKTNIQIIERRVDGPLSLVKARNIGLREASGEIVGFPDDDCWYEPEVLSKVARYFRSYPEVDCICVDVHDPEKNRSFGGNRPSGGATRVSYRSIFPLVISNGIFVLAHVVKRIGGGFNEELGVGTRIGSGEEMEFIARILDIGCRVVYLGKVGVCHEVKDNRVEGREKVHSYAFGFGYVNCAFLKRGHIEILPYFFKIIALSCAGILRYLFVPDKRALYWARLRGIWEGSIAPLLGHDYTKTPATEISPS